MAPVLDLVQATLSPIFLLTGAGIYLGFVQARLFRAVDRLRTLDEEGFPEWEGEDERELLTWRVRVLRNSIAFGTLTMAFTILTGMLLLANHFVGDPGRVSIPVAVLSAFGAGLLSFGVSLGFGLADTLRSLQGLELLVPGPAGDRDPDHPDD